MSDQPARLELVGLTTRCLGRVHHHYQTLDSTNRAAKEMAAHGEPGGVLVTADFQTAGRGRLDRRWESPPGSSIMASLILRPELNLRDSFRLTMAAAAAFSLAVERVAGLVPLIKWPNDLYLNDRKLAGVLTEIKGRDRLDWAVVGLGMNISAAPPEVGAIHLVESLGAPVDRGEILAAGLNIMEGFLDRNLAPAELRSVWLDRSLLLGREVTIIDGEDRIAGAAVDLDADGALVVETETGRRAIRAGDASVLKK